MSYRNNIASFVLGAIVLGGGYLAYQNWPALKFFYNQISYDTIVKGIQKGLGQETKSPLSEPAPVLDEPPQASTEPSPVDPDTKQWVAGSNIEWRVPEGKNHIYLKYKEKNGRLIMEYDFKVKPGERFELKAVTQWFANASDVQLN